MKDILRNEVSRFHAAKSTNWRDKTVYAQYLAQTYYYVCHSTRLLALAASRMGIEDEKIHHRFLQHAAEERSHHLLAERDLRKLGYALSDFPELPLTSALYQSQYYRVEFIGPKSVFGYILALEGNAVTYGAGVYDVVCRAHGEDAASFLRVHSQEDPSHLDTAFSVVAAMSQHEQNLVADNLRWSCAMYEVLLKCIGETPAQQR
jgi:hypothetical protein